MGLSKTIWTNPTEFIRNVQPEDPVLFFAPSVAQANARRFIDGFPGMVTYAVKTNPSEVVIENLSAAGVRGFDVASPNEIRLIRRLAPDAVRRMITPRTTGILGVHLWGRACPVAALQAVAEEYRLKLLFDASHAFGCTYGGVPIGTFGECAVFSFHATKFFNTFEGGAVVTDNEDLAAKMRLMKNFGFSGYDNVIYPGTNGKMTEMAAAMGLVNPVSYTHLTLPTNREV